MTLIIYLCAITQAIWSILSIVKWFETRNDEGSDDMHLRKLWQQRMIDFGLPIVALGFTAIAIIIKDTKILAILSLGVGYAALQLNSHYSTQWQRMKRRRADRD